MRVSHRAAAEIFWPATSQAGWLNRRCKTILRVRFATRFSNTARRRIVCARNAKIGSLKSLRINWLALIAASVLVICTPARNFPFRCPKCFVIQLMMFFRFAVCLLCLAAWPLCAQNQSQSLKLTDGTTVSGRLVAFKDQYIQVALGAVSETPVYTNIYWARVSQESLEQLLANPQAKPYATIFLDPSARERVTATSKKISILDPPRLDRPQAGSLFASPVMLVVLLLIYAANIYAGWEIGIFRQWSPAMVAAVSAFLPIIGPSIFL